MTQIRCDRCKGTGYASVARDAGMDTLPTLLQPVGLYQCPTCNGTGQVGFSDEAMAALKAMIRAAAAIGEKS